MGPTPRTRPNAPRKDPPKSEQEKNIGYHQHSRR